MARAAGSMRAAPKPWTARNTMSQASAASPAGVRPFITDPNVNTSTPVTTIRRCPRMSEIRPPKAKKAASESR